MKIPNSCCKIARYRQCFGKRRYPILTGFGPTYNSLKSFPLIIEEFSTGHKVFVAGSTWPEDEVLLAKLVPDYLHWKFIFAPHEISEEKISKLIDVITFGFQYPYSRYSQLSPH